VALVFDNRDQYVGRNGAPDLRLHRVLSRAEESFDAQVLFVRKTSLRLEGGLLERMRRRCSG